MLANNLCCRSEMRAENGRRESEREEREERKVGCRSGSWDRGYASGHEVSLVIAGTEMWENESEGKVKTRGLKEQNLM